MAIVTACCMFPLIFLGGLVTSHQAGMSVPDWPNSYGYNMFLFPPKLWVGGILYEHTHRLLGTVVGFCATVLALMAWAPGRSATSRRWIVLIVSAITVCNLAGTAAMAAVPARFHLSGSAGLPSHILGQGLMTQLGILLSMAVALGCRSPEPRLWVRWTCAAVFLAICLQGLLGGLRVDLINLPLAMVHGCFAQASFCLVIFTMLITSRWWTERGTADPRRLPSMLPALALTCTLLVYAQLIIGAIMRHLQAGLAIPDLPLVYGHWLPPTTAAQLAVINHQRIWQLQLPTVTLSQIWLHFAHRIGAVVVSTALICLIGRIISNHRRRDLLTPAIALAVLLAAQVTLGLLTVYLRKPADVASTHVAVGALVLATTFHIAVKAVRLYSFSPAGTTEASPALNPQLIAG